MHTGHIPEHRPQEDQDPKWPDFIWIALLVVAGLLATFLLWQGEQTNIQALLGHFQP